MAISFSSRFKVRFLSLVIAGILAAVGCSSGTKKLTINGKITYKGEPLPSGMIKFFGPKGSASLANIKHDGTFTITDVVPGEVKVAVEKALGGSRLKEQKSVDLPDKYRDPTTSGLNYTIAADTKELNIELK